MQLLLKNTIKALFAIISEFESKGKFATFAVTAGSKNLIICHILNIHKDLLSISLPDKALYLFYHLNPDNST